MVLMLPLILVDVILCRRKPVHQEETWVVKDSLPLFCMSLFTDPDQTWNQNLVPQGSLLYVSFVFWGGASALMEFLLSIPDLFISQLVRQLS